MLYRAHVLLLAVTPAVDTSQEGDAYAIAPSDTDRVTDPDQSFGAFIHVTQTGGASSPTTTVKVQTSVDGTNWIDAASVALDATGETTQFKDLVVLGPHVRAITEVGGGTPPDHTAKVTLVSTGPFRLRATS